MPGTPRYCSIVRIGTIGYVYVYHSYIILAVVIDYQLVSCDYKNGDQEFIIKEGRESI